MYKAKLINSWQNTNNIIDAINVQHQANLPEAKKIAKYFKGESETSTAKNIFNFLKSEIQYVVEPSENQTTKTISRFLADGKGDCKHFSLFTNTILESCGYRSVYRFAGYKGKGIQHVYSYLPKSDIICDAVLPTFDTEKTPTLKKDINMSLYSLSGIDNSINGLNFSKVAKNIKAATAKGSDVVKKAAASIPKAANDIKQGMVTAGLAPARAAFLALMQLNFTGMASDFKKIIAEKGDDGIKWWKELGGDRTAFTNAVESGSKRKAILSGVDEERAAYNEVYGGYSGDGVQIGVVVAATAATATPILIKAAEIIKKLKAAGIDPKKLAEQAKLAAEGFKKATGKNITDVIFKKQAGETGENKETTAADLAPVDDETAEKVATAAIAAGAGVDTKTIEEVKKDLPAPDKDKNKDGKKDGLFDKFKAMPKTNQYLIGGGILAVIGLTIYAATKPKSKSI